MTDILTVLGKNIKYHRTKLGLTQAELAEKADINRSYLASLEMGKRNTTVKTVEKLAAVLNITPAELLEEN